jgi:hypothetical protein
MRLLECAVTIGAASTSGASLSGRAAVVVSASSSNISFNSAILPGGEQSRGETTVAGRVSLSVAALQCGKNQTHQAVASLAANG